MGGQVVVNKKMKEQKSSSKTIDIVSLALEMSDTW